MGHPVIVYHPGYIEDYPTVHVECPDRVRAVHEALSPLYEEIRHEQADEDDLLRVHTKDLIESVRRENGRLFETAHLAAGGAIRTAREAMDGRPAFGVIRPPGHHASPDHHWGFCFFNNMAIAIARLLDDGRIKGAFILDFDLHFGDGTANYFSVNKRTVVFNPPVVPDRAGYVDSVRKALDRAKNIDLIGVSAGFDIGENDWGTLLKTEDFEEIGRLVKAAANRRCQGRRFGILEGGYNIAEIGKNAAAFCRGLF